MPSPEEPIEPEAAPPEAAPPTLAPPSFGLSGSVRQGNADNADTSPGAPSSPWWAPENLVAPSPPSPEQAAGAQERERTEAVPAEASGAAPADRGVVSPAPDTLVAGPGVPSADSRRALPARRPPESASPEFSDTLPDGIPPVPGPPEPPGPPPGDARWWPLPPAEPPTNAKPGFGGRRRLVLMGAGAVAVLAVGIAGITAVSGSSRPEPAGQSGPPGKSAAPPPSPSPANSGPARGAVPSIDNEKTDRRPLRLSEVFPARPLALGDRVYKQDKTSVNHDCALVAHGAMAEALVRRHCRGVVRATYVDTKKRLAVTAGVVAMPTRALAVAARKAGAPNRYEWFRGMPGKVAKDIDRAGGYAASTVRGRYIIYSYAAYLDGHAVGAGDQLLPTVGRQFVAYAVRPVERRSH